MCVCVCVCVCVVCVCVIIHISYIINLSSYLLQVPYFYVHFARTNLIFYCFSEAVIRAGKWWFFSWFGSYLSLKADLKTNDEHKI